MANLSIRIRDDLKRKARAVARRHGVSLNNFVNATLAAAVAQEETLAFFDDRLKDVDLEALHRRVLALLNETKPGDDPTVEELRNATGERF